MKKSLVILLSIIGLMILSSISIHVIFLEFNKTLKAGTPNSSSINTHVSSNEMDADSVHVHCHMDYADDYPQCEQPAPEGYVWHYCHKPDGSTELLAAPIATKYYQMNAPQGYVWAETEHGVITLMPDHLYSDMAVVCYIQGTDTTKIHYIN